MNQTRKKKYSNIHQNILSLLLKFVLDKGYSLVELIRKKVQKSKSLEIIADELECEPEEIRKLYDIIQKCGVEMSAEEILEELSQLEEK